MVGNRQPLGPAEPLAAAYLVTTTAAGTTLSVAGELDAASTEDLRDRVDVELSLAPRCLLLDLSEVAFCSAAALRALLEAAGRARQAAVPIAVLARHRTVLRPMELLGIDRELLVHHHPAEAATWLNGHPPVMPSSNGTA